MTREIGELTFSTSLGGKRIVRIPCPAALITQNMVDMAEGGIIAANPFDSTVGELQKLVRSERVATNRIPLFND